MSDRPAPKRQPGFFPTSSFLRLAVAEAAIVGGLAASGRTRPAGAVAVLLLAVTLARRNGRWWLDHRIVARGYRRRRAARPQSHRDARITALRALAPGLTVSTVAANGIGIGVACDGDAWFAVAEFCQPIRIGSPAGLHDPDGSAPGDHLFPDLAAMLRDCGVPGAAVQLVTHTVPAPAPALDPDCAAVVSYRELIRSVGPVPAERSLRLAVRADAETLARAGVRQADQAPAVVAGLARRAARAASRHGWKATALDADDLVKALSHSTRLGTAPHEEWDAWHSGRPSSADHGAGNQALTHRTYWLRNWPRSRDVATLLDRLAAAPAVLTSLALTLTAGDDSVDICCLIRVAAKPGDLANASEDLEATAHSMDAVVVALDGEQAPAVYASAPTGGGPR
ncbi:type VII secretion protein EccE [Catenulispora sp. GAS73]|uniref:type VII secretion protein EccE n=1 Tax=Catenulispora sp. GAS73 TaxID=3156269 RepID=UPI003513CEFD